MRHILLPLLLVFAVIEAPAAEWPSWRGPHGTGVADGSGYPLNWSTDRNLLWTIELPGAGNSTPAVAGDQIFLTLNTDGENRVLCLGMDGKTRWSKSLGAESPGKHKKATGSNPSPLTDGERVYAYFKSGDLGCFSLDGEVLWQMNVHDRFGAVTSETLWWDLGSSPVLVDGAVVLSCVQSGPSWIAALGRTDGEILWKVDRDLDAPMEANQTYSTPAVIRNANGSQTVVILGSDHITAHAASDGRELWRVGGLNPGGEKYFRSIASPVVANGIVLAPYARGTTLTAVRMGGTGDVTSSHVLYTREEASSDVPTPAILGDRAWICGDSRRERGTVSCLDPASGNIIWSGQLPKSRHTYSSSPVIADGRLYLTREDGTVFVVDALADEFHLLAENSLSNEFTVATPVFIDGRILLRNQTHLSLIGQ